MVQPKTEQEKAIALAHKVRKLAALLFRGNVQERETARQLLEELLTKNRKAWGDIDELIALSVNNPQTTRNDDSEDKDEPPPASSDGKMPDVFELVDWLLRRFLVLEDHQFTALTLWVLHSFVFLDFQHTPRLALLSPTRGCGKSVVLNLCQKLCLRARKFDSTSTASLPRLIDRDRPTVLLDEADNMNFAHEPVLRSILNAGFEAGGARSIVVKNEAREFKLFAPVAFGAIGRLPLPLMSRSIVINMRRAPRNAKIARFDLKSQTLLHELDVVYQYTFDWAQQVRGKLNTDPAMPDGFHGRVADRWRVLFSIADALGHGNKARETAKVFVGEHQDEDINVTLISHVRRVFGEFAERQIETDLLLKHLHALDDGRWVEFCGYDGDRAPRPLTIFEMTHMISRFGITTKTLWPRGPRRPGTKCSRGYAKADFEKAWASYCDDEGSTPPAQPSVIKHLRRP